MISRLRVLRRTDLFKRKARPYFSGTSTVRSRLSNAVVSHASDSTTSPHGLQPDRRLWFSSDASNDPAESTAALPPTSSSLSKVEVATDGASLTVSFAREEPQQSLFHASWLFANDPSYVHPSSGQRTQSPSAFFGWKISEAQVMLASDVEKIPWYQETARPFPSPPPGCLHPVGGVYQDVAPTAATDDSSEILCVTWRHSDGQQSRTSCYDLDWLWQCRYDDAALESLRSETEVRTEHAVRTGSRLVEINWGHLQLEDSHHSPRFTHQEAQYKLLHAVLQDGAAIVSSVKLDKGAASFVGKSLSGGELSHGSLYGDVFDVETVTDARNIAYTSEALPPHQDLAYYESSPGLQLLHCYRRRGVAGGESTLIDALAAANEFRRLAPEMFDILTRCEATFIKQREGADMVYRRPYIEQDSFGNITAVHWSPPFEGPASVRADEYEQFFVARAAFERMLDNSLPPKSELPISAELDRSLRDYAMEYTWEQRLKPGDMLVFNNQRMLHGRRGFVVTGDNKGKGKRHLIGCYTNIDDTVNYYRVLRRQRFGLKGSQAPVPVRNAGNGSSGTI